MRTVNATLFVGFFTSAELMAGPVGFIQKNLVSNEPGAAQSQDTTLINPWGLIATESSPFWLGVNGSGVSELYNGAGVRQGLTVTIQGDGSVTGVALGGIAGSFNGDVFLFASEDGTISGWRGALGSTAEVLQTGLVSNVYKGLTTASISGNGYLYLANFHSGTIDVVKGNSSTPSLTGNFLDPNLPSGYAPFNIMNLGNGELYVSYAVQDSSGEDDVAGAGNGIIDVFDLNGNLLRRLVGPGGVLNSPWGLALAPAGFGDLGGDLLVGNFGDGTIHAFNPTSGQLVETLRDPNGNPISIDGLWALRFGNGANAGPATTLFFTAGPNGEADGLFGQLTASPEPGTWLMMTSALGLIQILRKSRRRYIQ